MHVKAMTIAGNRCAIEVKPATRSNAENAMLHALLGRIASAVDWAGKKRDIETWKRMMVAAWCRARGEPLEMLPAIDGAGVDIVYAKTSKLSRKDCAELIEYVLAFCADKGIPTECVNPETGELINA